MKNNTVKRDELLRYALEQKDKEKTERGVIQAQTLIDWVLKTGYKENILRAKPKNKGDMK